MSITSTFADTCSRLVVLYYLPLVALVGFALSFSTLARSTGRVAHASSAGRGDVSLMDTLSERRSRGQFPYAQGSMFQSEGLAYWNHLDLSRSLSLFLSLSLSPCFMGLLIFDAENKLWPGKGGGGRLPTPAEGAEKTQTAVAPQRARGGPRCGGPGGSARRCSAAGPRAGSGPRPGRRSARLLGGNAGTEIQRGLVVNNAAAAFYKPSSVTVQNPASMSKLGPLRCARPIDSNA